MPLTFPSDCDTPPKRTEFCYRAQELLRLVHNDMGKWHREGLSRQEWDRLPQRLRANYPYKAQLSREQWDDFVTNMFETAEAKLINILLENRQLLKESTAWRVDIEEILDGN